jgi:hypothetical protein
MPTDREDWPQGWNPRVRMIEKGSGFFVLAETASGRRMSPSSPRPAIDRFPGCVADWLEAKVASLPESELKWPVSFVYVVVSAQLKPDGTIHVIEFDRGTAPAAPVSLAGFSHTDPYVGGHPDTPCKESSET